MWRVARRPRWIAALIAALALAAGFAALGQWQLGRAVESAVVAAAAPETPVPLDSVAVAQEPMTTDAAGRMVSVTGALAPGDTTILGDRVHRGTSGFWVMGHLVLDTGSSLAVALGWAATMQQADVAAESLAAGSAATTIVGRYLPSEAPQEGDFERGERTRASVAELINDWVSPPEGVYAGYVIAAASVVGLETIDAPPPEREAAVNWLNLFYAAEWAVFAGFAVFLWYRLVRDAWEREQAEQAPDVS